MSEAFKRLGKNARGFSIIEIVIAMAIAAGIVVGIVLMIRTFSGDVDINRATTQIETAATKIELYKYRNNGFPSQSEGLKAIPTKDQAEWDQLFKDPWGVELVYRYPGQKNPDGYDLFSCGPDKTPDTRDDIYGK